MIKYTLICPICDRPYLYKSWIEKIRSLNIDRKHTQLIVCNANKDTVHGNRIKQYLDTHEDFADITYLEFDQTKNDSNGRENWYYYLKLGSYVSDNYQYTLKHIKGDIVLGLEDDVIPHPDVFNNLLKKLNDTKDAGMIGAITRSKIHEDRIIAIRKGRFTVDIVDDMPPLIETTAQAFGCFVTYASIFKSFNFQRRIYTHEDPPDWGYCKYLKETFNLNNYVCTQEDTIHLFKDHDKVKPLGQVKGLGYRLQTDMIPYRATHRTIKRHNNKAPIIIVASTGRCGSTWIQRILNTHKDIAMWGEPHDTIDIIEGAFKAMKCNELRSCCTKSKHQYETYSNKGWIPNLQSLSLTNGLQYIRGLYNSHYNPTYMNKHKKVWGLKTINLSPMRILDIYSTFPDATFIFLSRNIKDVKESYDKRRLWWGKDHNFNKWANNKIVIDKFKTILPSSMHYIHMDYDEWKDKPVEICEYLEKNLNLKPKSLDRNIAIYKKAG